MTETSSSLQPKDHHEAVALFRLQVLGPLTCSQLEHGEQAMLLRELSQKRVRPPGSKRTRTFAVATLERWLHRYRQGGLPALQPRSRARGFALGLGDEQRQLLLDIRREHPHASVPLILDTLVNEGRLERGAVEASAVRRLYARHGLDRKTLAREHGKRERRRWATDRPGRLWHADVCHGPSIEVDGRPMPLRIHAILDDASRYIVGIVARSTELEVDMLELLTSVVRTYGKPEALYLDNGSTYRGEALATMCGRLNVTLKHAQPYDPKARGKMERFWRSLREGCLDFLGKLTSLHEVQVRLLAFLDRHYHDRGHAGLLGRSPATVWATRSLAQTSEPELHEALTVRAKRKLNGDGTVSVGGVTWESDAGWLGGHRVIVARSFASPQSAPWIELEDRKLPLRRVDAIANSKRGRSEIPREKPGLDAVAFNPNNTRVDALLGRRPKGGQS